VQFHDPRHFGTLKFVKGREQLNRKLATLGPDMLSGPPDEAGFRSALLKKPTRTVAEALMDQSVVSGVGNYVKCEALYAAGVSPHRTVESLTCLEHMHLRRAIIDVMEASYTSGGATIATYRQGDGAKGQAQSRFMVYGNKTDPSGNPVVREQTLDGRTTHWCPAIQA
jgi:DNA-formamidopyrimidine glycosylase